MRYAPKVIEQDDIYDDSQGEDDFNIEEDNDKQIPKSESQNKAAPDDEAAYQITDDAGYAQVLSEKFGHKEFREG